jgi:hypothetical protein
MARFPSGYGFMLDFRKLTVEFLNQALGSFTAKDLGAAPRAAINLRPPLNHVSIVHYGTPIKPNPRGLKWGKPDFELNQELQVQANKARQACLSFSKWRADFASM